MPKKGEKRQKVYNGPTHTCNIGLVINQEAYAKLNKIFRYATIFKNCIIYRINGLMDIYVNHPGYQQYATISKQIKKEKLDKKKNSQRYKELHASRVKYIQQV